MAQLGEADIVVSDAGLSSGARASLADAGNEVMIAEFTPPHLGALRYDQN